MQQFFSLLSWRSFTAQHVSGISPPIIRSSMTAVAASGFTFVSWWQPCCVFVVGPAGRLARPRPTALLSPRYEGKPEAATAVDEFLMMGGRTSETCWAVNKRQDNKLHNCCIWLVIYLNCAVTMHGLTNLKNEEIKLSCRVVIENGKIIKLYNLIFSDLIKSWKAITVFII